MQRTLEPELLDSLPPDHPDSLHNRRDLRRVNAITGNHRWFGRVLPHFLRPDELVLEVGSGTGELGRRLHAAGIPVDGLDLWPRPDDWPADRAWHTADLRAFDGYHRYPVIVGNLIFHQFSDEELAALGKKISPQTRIILASEPARRRLSQSLFRAFGRMSGANHVSLHDGHVSIAAGFRDEDLARLLALDRREWNVQCRTTLLGMYRMIAIRRPGATK